MTLFVDIWDIVGLAILAIGIGWFILACVITFIHNIFEQIGKRIHNNKEDDDNDGC